AFAFGDPARDVVLGRGVVLATVQDDRVECAVELAVPAAAESMSSRLAAGGGDRRDAGEACEGGLGAEAVSVRPGDNHLRGDDRADSRLVESLWCEGANTSDQLPFALGGFCGDRFDSAGQAAQHEQCGELVV